MHDGFLIDVAIIMVMAVATATGLSRGLLSEAVSLFVWLLAALLAALYFTPASAWLAQLMPGLGQALRHWLLALAFIGTTLITLILLENGIRRRLKLGRALMSGNDPLLGLVFGLLRGSAVIVLAVVLAHRTQLPDRLSWHQSQFVGYAEGLALTLRPHLPPPLAAQIRLRGTATDDASKGPARVVLAHDSRGHFTGRAWINGMPVEVLIDTGATMVMVPAHLAERLSLRPDHVFPVNTATGRTVAQFTTIDAIKLGPIVLHDIEAALVESPKNTVLIGMSFLLKTRFRQTADGLLIERARPLLE